MLKFTTNNPTTQADLLRRVEDLDEYQARLVLAFINNLFGTETTPPAEMEVAA